MTGSAFAYTSLGAIDEGTVSSTLQPAKAVMAVGLLLTSGAGWALTRTSRLFGMKAGAPAQALQGPLWMGATSGGESAFLPKDGIESVIVRGAPLPGLLGGVPPPLLDEASCIFIYNGAIPKELSASTSSTDGWVYGAKLQEGESLAMTTAQPGDVVKGKLLCWPATSFKLLQTLRVADKHHHYDSSHPQKGSVRRSVVKVVGQEGAAIKAFFYYQVGGPTPSSPDFWPQVLAFAESATHSVGDHILAGTSVKAQDKADGSVVTQFDIWADGELRGLVLKTFPDHGVLSEEGDHVLPATDFAWIIDPIDGTTNFALGLPIWGISMGLLYKGTPVFGYVHMPPLHQSFYGYWPGDSGLSMPPAGAFLNGQPMHSSKAPLTGNQFFNLCARSAVVLQQKIPAKPRMLGSTIYSFLTVAGGISLAAVEATPKIWDIAALYVIVHASGAVFYPLREPGPIFPLTVGQDYSKRNFPTLIVARPDLLPTFLPLVEEIGKPKKI
eukprot:gb/GEZN01004594.1/.p1 GENE.gb/GEZN01004594.1/~~gb/GEZN01004594.1/.p1  ORF type:complete len:497 (-),score=52.82 gb/GEZN01004594.1/:415-1905(-)